MFDKVKTFVSEHPWGTAAIVFTAGIILLYLFWPRSSGSASTGTDLSPYYNAQAAAVNAGSQVYGTQIAANAAVAENAAALDAQTKIAGIAAGVQNTAADDQLSAIQTQIAAELAALQSNNKTTVDTANIAAGVSSNANATALAINGQNTGAAVAVQGSQERIAGATLATQSHEADVAAQTSQLAATTAAQTSQYAANLAAQVAEFQTSQGSSVAWHQTDTNYLTAIQTAQLQASTATRQAELAVIQNATVAALNAGNTPALTYGYILNPAEYYANTRGSGQPGVPYP